MAENASDILKRLEAIHNSSSTLKDMKAVQEEQKKVHRQEMEGMRKKATATVPPQMQTQNQIAVEHPDNKTEFIDTSNPEEGSAFLFWHDAEAESNWGAPQRETVNDINAPNFERAVRFPEKSGVFLAKYVDFKTENEKKTALSHLAEIVSDYENQPSNQKRGKYFILLGRLVDVEVKKQIVIK